MEALLEREKELKDRLSEIGSKIKKNKRDLQLSYNALYVWKRDLYKLKCETELPEIYGLSDFDCWHKENEMTSLKYEIDWKRESLPEREDEQRKLVNVFKDVNRELSRIQKRIQKKAIKEDK